MTVDAIDEILSNATNDTTMTVGSGAGNDDGGSGGALMQDNFARPTIPSLHRPDGGLHRQRAPSGTRGVATTAEETTVVGEGYYNQDVFSMMVGEESSLSVAREFLSRLLLILVSFVILCLLLF